MVISMNNARRIPTQPELETLVIDELKRQIASLTSGHAGFTAYTVTQALRAANPDVQIDHGDVRGIVVKEMDALLTENLNLTNRFEIWNGVSAMTYNLSANIPANDEDEDDEEELDDEVEGEAEIPVSAAPAIKTTGIIIWSQEEWPDQQS